MQKIQYYNANKKTFLSSKKVKIDQKVMKKD